MRELYIGLISGTSMDGIDCALIDTTNGCQFIAGHCHPIPDDLKNTLWQLISADDITDPRIVIVNEQLGELFAEATKQLLQKTDFNVVHIKAIGSHGQNISHHPNDEKPHSLQIGNPQIIADRTGITTVADFRSADIAAGGQGAPLAPLFHNETLRSAEHNRAIVNIGGIANVTFLSRKDNSVIGFDTGPGNGLMDAWIHKNQQKDYDQDGQWAASGTVDQTLLTALLHDPYFRKVGPKSTGKEYFNLKWLHSFVQQQTAADIQASLLELTAQTIYNTIEQKWSEYQLILCGGGAHNSALVNRLQTLTNQPITTSEHYGFDADYLEAMLFAWLAKKRITNTKLDTRTITGATKPILLGRIFTSNKD
jgi:anhydro-N-acetylmuramic acid kinase